MLTQSVIKCFLREFMKTKVSRRTVWAFVRYLEESAVSVVDYADIIIQLCENVLHMEIEDLRKQWGIEDEISKLIIFYMMRLLILVKRLINRLLINV